MKKLLTILSLTALAAGAITIDSTCKIVLPDAPNIQEEYAAGELANYLGKVLGSDIATIKEAELKGGVGIFIGDTKKAASFKFESFSNEEFQIKADHEAVVIAGGRFRGILYGAYEFLERFAGVRFFSPACEVVPQKKSLDVADETSIRHKPAFEYRYIYPGEAHIGWPQKFRPKFRTAAYVGLPELGGSNDYGTGGGCHTYYKYSKDFPKEISWMSSNGERVIVTQPYMGSICFSQPEVLRRFTVRLKELIKGDREKAKESGCPPPVFYAVQQNDCNATCFCPECLAFKEKHGLSGLVVDFSNRLADSIKDEYPDVYILIFAYFDTLEPPKSDIRPRPNVLTQITTYTKPFHDHLRGLDDPVNKGAVELIDKWSSISDCLAMWDYWRYYGGFLPPATIVKSLPSMMKKYRDSKMIFYFTEFEVSNATILAFFDLTCYVGFKLLDNPDLDGNTLINEFMAAYYGAAAPFMRDYLDLLTEKFVECGPVNEERIQFSKRKYLNDKEFFSKGFELFEKAEKAANGDGTLLKRIHAEKLILVSSYIKVLAKNGNPLNLDIDALKSSVQPLCEDAAALLLRDASRKPDKIKEMVSYYADINNLKPTQNLTAKPLDVIPAEGAKIFDFFNSVSSGVPVDDKDAPDKQAYSIAGHWTPEDNLNRHNKSFIFGMYEQANAHYVSSCSVAKKDLPQDEKYHWYYAGNTCLYPKLILFIHWTWMLNVQPGKYYDANDPNQSYDIYVLIKLQGPAYVEGSKQTNDVRVARMAFVKK